MIITDTDSLVIRPATETDIDAITALMHRSWFTTWAPELPLPAVRIYAEKDPDRRYIDVHWAGFRISEMKGRMVGLYHADGDLLAEIHVDPRFKRQGIGTAMIAEAEHRIFTSHGTARLEVRAFNTDAQAFYHQRGWTEARRFIGDICGTPVETIEMVKRCHSAER
ncbi:N-acetyltransferase [Azospirillum sp.]|uniref:GNAT family N-acetyltransferase n=1 Tax=Azospirillum sp. TaxID=34012 RepID=UPI002D22F617|nr:N-acetyltransferase [Azospirillum sp.]HYD67621.1 N-acetyltransferase [Azospirillum sp.]